MSVERVMPYMADLCHIGYNILNYKELGTLIAAQRGFGWSV